MRRLAPRRLEAALDTVVPGLRPATTLARVQEAWPRVVGPALAEEAQPVAERRGVVTVSCRSSLWAQELQLLSGDLLERLTLVMNEDAEPPALTSLRFVTSGRGRAT